LKRQGGERPFPLNKCSSMTNLTYQIKLHQGIKKDIKGIPNDICEKISAAILALASNPYIGYKLAGKYKGQMAFDFSYRYRIIYQISKENKALTVLEIWHRSKDYKK